MTWTNTKNERRCDLIDMEIEGTITLVEKRELDDLQRKMSAHRKKVAPLPMDYIKSISKSMEEKRS